LPEPVIVTVPVAGVNVEPAPDVSQSPETVHEPFVRVIVPEVPPVIPTLETDTADAFAIKTPAFPIVSAPPVRERLDVARVVVPLPPCTVSVPAHFSPFVAVVNVTVLDPPLNVTLLNSLTDRFDPAKVIVWDDDALKTTVPLPAPQDADVEALAHEPETVHVSDPNAK